MRSFIAMVGGLTMSFFASQSLAQVATMGGMANPSMAGSNMNVGANVATMGGNANFGAVRSGVGGGYGGTTATSGVMSNLSGSGGYPLAARDARYFGQNTSTVAGMYGTGAAAVANQPGQPFALNRYRSTFTGGGNVANYNPTVQERFGGVNNGQGYAGQNFSQGNSRGYNVPNNAGMADNMNGGYSFRFRGSNIPGSAGFYAPVNNGLPAYTNGQNAPSVWPGYAPSAPVQNSAGSTSPPTNLPPTNLPPGAY